MTFSKIAGPIRITCGDGPVDVQVPLNARPGGRACKSVQFMVKVVSTSGTGPKVGFVIKHGPESTVLKVHTSTAVASVPADNLYVFDAGSAIIGEYIRGVLVAGGTANGDSTVVEVYEMRKPF